MKSKSKKQFLTGNKEVRIGFFSTIYSHPTQSISLCSEFMLRFLPKNILKSKTLGIELPQSLPQVWKLLETELWFSLLKQHPRLWGASLACPACSVMPLV